MRKWIILFVLVTLWGYGGIQALSMNTADGRIFMYYREGEGPRAEELDRALGREQGETAGTEREDQGGSVYPELTAWSLAEEVKVQNLELGRDKKADCLSVYGLMELASCRELEQGTYGYRTDREGCVISKGLAMDLFGAVEVTGKRVVCRDRPYIVRGVTDDPDCVILIPAKKEEGMRCLLMDYGKGASAKTKAEGFLYRYGMKRGYVCVDGSLFFAAAGMASLLPLWASALWLCQKTVKPDLGVRDRMCSGGAGILLLAAGIFLIWRLGFGIPGDIIPTRWSDFDFWTRKFGELQSDMERMGEAYQVQWLDDLKKRLFVCTVCCLTAGTGGIIWLHCMKWGWKGNGFRV